MPSSPPLLLLSLLLFFFLIPFSAASSTPVSLALSRLPLPPHPDPLHRLAALASASALRASLLKSRRRHASPPLSHSPLFPHSYGGYSLTLAFGTPPQQVPLLLDTGSHLTWLPCTTSYECRRCSSPFAAPITPFLPKSSASVRLVGCRNPRCLWIHPADLLLSRCPACNSTSADGCPVATCPPYVLIYGSGSTAGLLMLETLAFPHRTLPDFAVGCSVFSERQPAGVAAFGRGAPSLPSQLGLKRFSYCLISRRYDDDAAESGSVVLDPPKQDSSDGLSFTPFLNNSAAGADERSPFSVYYYVGLHEIAVGGKKVKVPRSVLVPSPSGDGGAIVDSGTTFTYMAPPVFEPVLAAFVGRVAGRYNRSAAVEDQTGLRPCFALPQDAAEVDLPELSFRFKGGSEMRLPLENYFAFAGSDRAAVCLAIVSDQGGAAASSDVAGGPAVILGNFQQQDYYVVYDLERGRLGFRRQSCLGS